MTHHAAGYLAHLGRQNFDDTLANFAEYIAVPRLTLWARFIVWFYKGVKHV